MMKVRESYSYAEQISVLTVTISVQSTVEGVISDGREHGKYIAV